jgi:hypothetical protein
MRKVSCGWVPLLLVQLRLRKRKGREKKGRGERREELRKWRRKGFPYLAPGEPLSPWQPEANRAFHWLHPFQKLEDIIRRCTLGKETEPTTRISLGPKGRARCGREEEEGQVKRSRAGRKETGRRVGLTPSLATSSCFSAFCFLML